MKSTLTLTSPTPRSPKGEVIGTAGLVFIFGIATAAQPAGRGYSAVGWAVMESRRLTAEVRRRHPLVLLWPLALLAVGAAPAPDREYEYQFFTGATGLAQAIRVDGKTVFIELAPESNREARALLESLVPAVLSPSHRRIRLVGRLAPEVKVVPLRDGDGPVPAAGGEHYQQFELHHWYIRCPFQELDEDRIIGGRVRLRSRTHLRRAHFAPAPAEIDLRRYERPLSSRASVRHGL